MTASGLAGRVSAVAEVALASLPPGGPLHERLDVLRRGLDEPLRVAVAGREKAGKSTFVNAVLGRNLAPTDAGVCTKVVTWYRHGENPWVEVVGRSPREMPLVTDDDGQAVIPIDEDASEIDHITIRLPLDVLSKLTIIDTPGLASLNERLSRRSRDYLFADTASRTASAAADGLIFLLSPTTMDDDRQVLTEFSERFGGLRASAANAVGVLSRADQVGDGLADPWPIAQAMASRQASVLTGLVSTVVPMVGLLAESSAHFEPSDMAALVALAGVDRATRDVLLLDLDLFRGAELSIATEARERLVNLLGRYGLRTAIQAIDDGMTGTASMVRHLRSLSGLPAIQKLIENTFAARADALRAGAAAAALEQLAFTPDAAGQPALRRLRDDLEELELEPAMHRVNEIRAGEEAAREGEALPEELRIDLHRLLTGTTPEARLGRPPGAPLPDLLDAARAGEARWRAFAAEARTPFRSHRIAETFARSHGLLIDALAAAAPTT